VGRKSIGIEKEAKIYKQDKERSIYLTPENFSTSACIVIQIRDKSITFLSSENIENLLYHLSPYESASSHQYRALL
jgi:hypothetical protein